MKTFLIVGVVKDWNRLPRDAVKSPSLVLFKTSLDMVLSKQLGLMQFWVDRLG